MIEIPRAALLANFMAKTAQFFSFGTNDLTQMTFGFSRDDIGAFMNDYLENKLLDADPFQTIDIESVGKLIDIGVQGGRSTNPKLKVGICGEHGGDPASIRRVLPQDRHGLCVLLSFQGAYRTSGCGAGCNQSRKVTVPTVYIRAGSLWTGLFLSHCSELRIFIVYLTSSFILCTSAIVSKLALLSVLSYICNI